MKLTERQKVSGLTLTDLIHVVVTNDTSQDSKGSSYKADVGQFIQFIPKSVITKVNDSNLFSTGLAGTGTDASGVTNSNFFGPNAGNNATNATSSNFIGASAGAGATNASSSNFLNYRAGYGATDASNSNFMGQNAGYNATDARDSNFFGVETGFEATNARNSNFLGFQAGLGATNASNSNLFGYKAGLTYSGNNIGSNNIIIGTNISLPNTIANSINIGGVLFGSGTYSNISGNPSITGQTQGRIGINVVNPTNTLHVYSQTNNTSGLRLERLISTSPTSTGQAIGVDISGNVVTIPALDEPYTNTTPTTATVGGITVGSTFNNQTMKQMWDLLLYPYQTPAFTSFNRTNLLTEYDLGRPVLAGSQTFTWATSNSGNIQANTIKIEQLFPSTDIRITGSANDGTETINLTGAIISSATPTTISMYRITATNTKSVDITTTMSSTWKHRWYYGKNTNSSLTNAEIIALTNTNLITTVRDKNISFLSSANPEYLYLITPQSIPQPTDWRDSTVGCFGNNIPFLTVGSTSITNAYGIATTYNIYRSVNQITGAQEVWLCA